MNRLLSWAVIHDRRLTQYPGFDFDGHICDAASSNMTSMTTAMTVIVMCWVTPSITSTILHSWILSPGDHARTRTLSTFSTVIWTSLYKLGSNHGVSRFRFDVGIRMNERVGCAKDRSNDIKRRFSGLHEE